MARAWDELTYDGGIWGGAAVADTAGLTLAWAIDPSPARVDMAIRGLSGPPSYYFRYERRTLAGALVADITDGVLAASFDANNDRDIFAAASFTFDPQIATADPLRDYIQAWQVLLVDGAIDYAIPIGLFAPALPKSTLGSSYLSQVIAAADVLIELQRDGPSEPYTVPAGANLVAEAIGIIEAKGLRYNIPASDLTAAAAMTWFPNDATWLTIVNGLVTGAGMYIVWADPLGIITTRGLADNATREPDVTYSDTDFVLTDDIPIDIDDTLPANRITGIVTDPNRAALSVTRTNNDPASPISTVNLGRVIPRILKLETAADIDTLTAAVDRALRAEAEQYRRATITTPIDARRTAREVYALDIAGGLEGMDGPRLDGFDGGRWAVRTWKFTAAVGARMSHDVARTAPITLT